MGDGSESVPVVKRTRAHKPKVRTGCVTCKSRRVKCDELRPFCLNCTKTGRKCEGYVPLNAWIFEVKDKNDSVTSSIVASPSSTDYSDPVQSRALTYYRERVAPTLACFAIEAQDFFNVTVPQASHSQPVIKHMVIAIASLQEAIESSPSEMAQCRVIFGRHYSNAVAELTQRDGPPPTEVVLISCLLFLACENFQGSTLAGLLHIQSGLKILQDWKTSQRQQCITNGSTDDLISTQIEPIFTRLETQMAVYTAPRAPESPYPSPGSVHLQKPPVLPSSFANLFGARDSLDDIMQWTFNGLSLEDQPFTSLTATIISRKLLHNWLQAMKVLTNSITSHGLVEARTASALLVHYRVISIWLDERTATIETTYDKYRDDFRTLLIQSERIIMHREYGVTSDWSEYNDRMSLFESDFGMIPPLFFIACHCRDSALRRKATRLMRYLHRAEGAWDSCSAAKIVDGIIDIEERGIAVVQSCRNISEHKRIRAVDADINPAYTSSVVLTFTRWPYTEPHQELIDWASWSRSELASLTVWPLETIIRNGGYQGLIRPVAGACLCKVYQAQFAHQEFTPAEVAVRDGPPRAP